MKPKRIAAAQKSLEQFFDPRLNRTIGGDETLVIDREHLLEVILDDLLERVREGARRVACFKPRLKQLEKIADSLDKQKDK